MHPFIKNHENEEYQTLRKTMYFIKFQSYFYVTIETFDYIL